MFVQSVYVFSAGDLVLRAVNIDVRACYLWKQMFSQIMASRASSLHVQALAIKKTNVAHGPSWVVNLCLTVSLESPTGDYWNRFNLSFQFSQNIKDILGTMAWKWMVTNFVFL